jgi:hypothetical protein
VTVRTRMRVAMSIALWLFCSSALAAAEVPKTPQRVPAVDCLANDQAGPGSLQTHGSMPAPAGRAQSRRLRTQGLVLPGLVRIERKRSHRNSKAY